MCVLKGIIYPGWLCTELSTRLIRGAPYPCHTSLFHSTQGSCTHFSCLALCVTPGLLNYKNLISPNKPNALLHTNSTVGLLAMSQLRQLVLCNVKCSPMHTLAEILKNTSIKNSIYILIAKASCWVPSSTVCAPGITLLIILANKEFFNK